MYIYNDVTTRLTLKKYLIHVYVNTKSTLNSVYFWRWLNTDIGKCGFLKKKKEFLQMNTKRLHYINLHEYRNKITKM